MLVDRNTIGAAFLGLFTSIGPTGSGPFTVVSDHWKAFSNTPSQPSLYILDIEEIVSETATYGGPKWKLKTSIWIYDNSAQDPAINATTVLNTLIDSVDRAIKPQYMMDVQTLGLEGVVSNCYIDGKLIKVIGVLGPQSVAVIPVTIDVAG